MNEATGNSTLSLKTPRKHDRKRVNGVIKTREKRRARKIEKTVERAFGLITIALRTSVRRGGRRGLLNGRR